MLGIERKLARWLLGRKMGKSIKKRAVRDHEVI